MNDVDASEDVLLSDGDCEEMLRTTPRVKIYKKRRSFGGAIDNKIADDEQNNMLKRRNIKVAGAPKMPLNAKNKQMANEAKSSILKEINMKNQSFKKANCNNAKQKPESTTVQQNEVLEKYVENMKVRVHKITTENNELEEKNKLMGIYLQKLKKKLAEALGVLALPNEPNGATADNIENFLAELYKMSTSNTHGPACLNKARDILRKLDMQIDL